jgi:hypothetical protein
MPCGRDRSAALPLLQDGRSVLPAGLQMDDVAIPTFESVLADRAEPGEHDYRPQAR